jgi:competence protein ComEA
VPTLAGLGGLIAGAAAVLALVLAVGALPAEEDALAFPEPVAATSSSETGPGGGPSAALVIDVAGAVVSPGLHRLRPGARVGDAIEAAGGFAPRADLAASSQSLNLAQPLEDGAKVLVPELGLDRAATDSGAADDGRLDLNRASSSELESLPGIGPVTAGKIIAAREDERFGAVRELRDRGLVGEKVFEDVKGLVRAS